MATSRVQIICYDGDHFGPAHLADFILANDDQSFPRMSRIVDINAYVNKIATFADILLAVDAEEIAGIIACYNNDVNARAAFITYFCVAQKYRNLGIGRLLLRSSLAHTISTEMLTVSLETWCGNRPALALYRSEGFVDQYMQTALGVCNMVLMRRIGD
jgi:ribosomal protein S18 acetylase RimI-like enzyme